MIVSAPMREISRAPLTTAVSAAKGLGFIAAGDDLTALNEHLQEAQELTTTIEHLRQYSNTVLPVGVGFLNWGAPLHDASAAIIRFRPAAVWLFGPRHDAIDLIPWVDEIRARDGEATRTIWQAKPLNRISFCSIRKNWPKEIVVGVQQAG